jgi:hypothetical protein
LAQQGTEHPNGVGCHRLAREQAKAWLVCPMAAKESANLVLAHEPKSKTSSRKQLTDRNGGSSGGIRMGRFECRLLPLGLRHWPRSSPFNLPNLFFPMNNLLPTSEYPIFRLIRIILYYYL